MILSKVHDGYVKAGFSPLPIRPISIQLQAKENRNSSTTENDQFLPTPDSNSSRLSFKVVQARVAKLHQELDKWCNMVQMILHYQNELIQEMFEYGEKHADTLGKDTEPVLLMHEQSCEDFKRRGGLVDKNWIDCGKTLDYIMDLNSTLLAAVENSPRCYDTVALNTRIHQAFVCWWQYTAITASQIRFLWGIMFNCFPNGYMLQLRHLFDHQSSSTSCFAPDHPQGCPMMVRISRELEARGVLNTFDRFLRYALLRRKGWVNGFSRKHEYITERTDWERFQGAMPQDVSMGPQSKMVNYLKRCLENMISWLEVQWGKNEINLIIYAALRP